MTDSSPYIARMAPPAVITADELLRLDLVGKRTELVRMQNAGGVTESLLADAHGFQQ